MLEGYPSSTGGVPLHTTLSDKGLGEAARVEALSHRARIFRFVLYGHGPGGHEPVEGAVESLPDQSLEPLVAGGAFAAEVVPFAVAPDHAGREEHRPAGPGSLLAHEGIDAELA